jgi:hypothetical protein
MGSSGSGRISDYPGTSKKRRSPGGSNGDGGGAPEDRCGRAFSTALEDIEHSEYFASHGAPPPVGEALRIGRRKRLVAETADGQSVGNIPTALNFLAGCLKDGWGYTGRVSFAKATPLVASVTADFAAIRPK